MAYLVKSHPKAFLRGEILFFCVSINFFQGVLGHIPPPKAGNIPEDDGALGEAAKGGPNFLGKNTAGPKRKIPVDYGDFFSRLKMPPD